MESQTQVPAIVQNRTDIEYIPFGADTKIKLTVKIVRDMIAIPTKTKKLPTDNECMRFMMLCRARKLNPFEGDCFLQGYDGQEGPQFSLITAHQAFLKRAEVNPEYDGMTSGVIVKNEDSDAIIEREGDFLHPGDFLLGGWARVFFKNRKVPTYRRLNLSTFDQGFGRWKKDKAGMIVKCAEADALRSSFPTMLGGLYSVEESGAVIDIGATSSVKEPEIRKLGQPKPAAPLVGDPQAATKLAGNPTSATAPATAPEPGKVVDITPPGNDPANPTIGTTDASEPPAAEEAPESSEDGDLGPQTEFVPNLQESDELQSVRLLMHRSGVTEAQVVAWCKLPSVKMAKPEQNKLGDLSTAKLKTIAAAWPNRVAEIRSIGVGE